MRRITASSFKNKIAHTFYAAFLAVTCSGCGSIDYVGNDRLRMMDVVSSNEPGRVYGAIVIKKEKPEVAYSSEGDIESPIGVSADNTQAFTLLSQKEAEPGRVFVLKRHEGRYMAETLMFDNSGDPKSWFDKSYFSFGAQQKTKNLGFQFRFVF